MYGEGSLCEAIAMDVYALVSDEPLDVTPIEEFVQDSANGAVVTFTGVIRDTDDGRAQHTGELDRVVEQSRIAAAAVDQRVTAAGGMACHGSSHHQSSAARSPHVLQHRHCWSRSYSKS